MDPLSALGLAVNIFAVIDFSVTCLSFLDQIAEAGSTAENSQLETIVKSLKVSNDVVKQWPRASAASIDYSVRKMC